MSNQSPSPEAAFAAWYERVSKEWARVVLARSPLSAAQAVAHIGLTPETSAQPPEIRRNGDGTLDEVVASGCDFHLEQLGNGDWWMSITSGGQCVHVNLSTRLDADIHADVHQEPG